MSRTGRTRVHGGDRVQPLDIMDETRHISPARTDLQAALRYTLKLKPPSRPHPRPDIRVDTLEIEGEELIVLSHPIDAHPSGLLDELKKL
jgi:hypothetical protein